MQQRWKLATGGLLAAGIAALVLSGLGSRAQDLSLSVTPRYVWLEREAVLVQAPHVIADATVHFARWTPDGRHVLALRSDVGLKPDLPTPPEMSIVLWNTSARRAFSVWKHGGKVSGTTQKGVGLTWLPGSQVGLLPISWMETSLQTDAAGTQQSVETMHETNLLIDVGRERVQELPVTADTQVQVSPTKPELLLQDPKENIARILDKSGAVRQTISLPQRGKGVNVFWMPDGSALLLTWVENAPDTSKLVRKRARLNLATHEMAMLEKAPGPLQELKEEHAPQNGTSAGALHIKQTLQVLRMGETMQRTRPLWLESDVKSERMQTLLCADATEGRISPRGDAALYLAQGVAWVTPLARAPRDEYMRGLRLLTMQYAKQAGLAVMMYAQDYDETFPSAGDKLNEIIQPYLQNGEVAEGLNYSYPGGAIGDIKDPAATVLGTYSGPGGVAVIYADGHVKWKAN